LHGQLGLLSSAAIVDVKLRDVGEHMRIAVLTKAVPLFLVVALWGADTSGKTETVKGYVLDSACAFTKGLDKPISRECALACAKAGSSLAILTSDGTIYWPIAGTTPSAGQNDKLLPFAGEKVTASGKVFERKGSKAIVIDKIEADK
jgi:hypothetical protein